ncbi:MAG TPA: electron transfer flavoprotein subunit alpha [Verrucomicrobiota bacterium]|nr:electron transfer flavoprotein subunit alpha [Verrucomicrobiota bacterium]HNU51318.1 electron transfer flavoprotein subunit alpha [Verrucomicrobiota bacterium]
MDTVLVLAHTESDGSLGGAAREVLGLARTLGSGGGFVVGLMGERLDAGAAEAAGSGASRVLGIADAALGVPRYGTDAAAAAALCEAAGASVVLAAGTSRFMRCLPGVAQRLGGRVDTHVTGVSEAGGVWTVNRWYYRQRMEATLQRTHRPWVLLVDPGSQPAWRGEPAEARVEPVPVELAEGRTRTAVQGLRDVEGGAQTIRPDAELLFVTGAGWTKPQADGQAHVAEAEQLILRFLELTRASLGSSKSLVDLGGEGQAVLSFLSHLNQIGQTGSTPRHAKGLATCCHGEEPHTVGWRFITERRAISLDANCGWARGKADVLYVADAFAVIRKVNELLLEKG